MIKLDAHKAVHFCDGLTRRDFLHAGALGIGGLGLTLSDLFALKAAGAVNTDKDVNCICLFLVGAPSQLDTWDMKPDSPSEIRGPYKAIKTNVPGIQISEIFRGWRRTPTSSRSCGRSTTQALPCTTPGIR
jgi:hypothetical protein